MNLLITGGTGGIGKVLTRHFAERGCQVVFLYHRNEECARTLTKDFGAEGICCDFAEPQKAEPVFDALRRRAFDGLILAAGAAQSCLFQQQSADEIIRMMNVNLTSAILTAHAVLPHMLSAQHGRILGISSMWGARGAALEAVYSATKAGLDGFVRALSKEVGLSGITVNGIAPGAIDTPMLSGFSAEDKQLMADASSVGRLGTPEDIAAAAEYFLSDAASFVTGQILEISGGWN